MDTESKSRIGDGERSHGWMMKAEYKRDMNHNYLILYQEEPVDTASYQVRMLVGNVTILWL